MKHFQIALWIKILCAMVMATDTSAGGWRIIRTLGHKMVRRQSVHGFSPEASSAAVIGFAPMMGIPVSTTHNISAAIMGVGAAKRFSALNWTIVEKKMPRIRAKINSALAVSSAKKCAAKRQEVVFLPHIFLHRMPFLLESPVKAVVGVNS